MITSNFSPKAAVQFGHEEPNKLPEGCNAGACTCSHPAEPATDEFTPTNAPTKPESSQTFLGRLGTRAWRRLQLVVKPPMTGWFSSTADKDWR